jgi:lupus La protein
MWTLHTANDEHWVPISTVASFKRMREFAPLGLPWIVDALKKSEELEIDSAGEKVRRRSEVKPPAGLFERSIYAVSTRLLSHMAKLTPYWHVERVRRRRCNTPKEIRGIFQQVRTD